MCLNCGNNQPTRDFVWQTRYFARTRPAARPLWTRSRPRLSRRSSPTVWCVSITPPRVVNEHCRHNPRSSRTGVCVSETHQVILCGKHIILRGRVQQRVLSGRDRARDSVGGHHRPFGARPAFPQNIFYLTTHPNPRSMTLALAPHTPS